MGIMGLRCEWDKIQRCEVWDWDGRAAAHEVARLAHVVTVRDVQLKCQCAPRRCHGHEIAARMLFEQMWARTEPKREPSPWL